jgi:hypothetical protein
VTINIPANAPHSFTNVSQRPARMLRICAPAGQEEFFLAVGVPVESRTTPPKPEETTGAAMLAKMAALLPKFRTEMVGGVVKCVERQRQAYPLTQRVPLEIFDVLRLSFKVRSFDKRSRHF